MAFTLSRDVEITRDQTERVRSLDHPRQPYIAGDAAGGRAGHVGLTATGDAYLAEVAPIYGISPEAIRDLDAPDAQPDLKRPESLHRVDVAPLPDGSGTVAYVQRLFNLDVWQAGIAATILANPLRVVGSRSSIHHGIKVRNQNALKKPVAPRADRVSAALGLERGQKRIRIHSSRLLIYQYDLKDSNAVGKGGKQQGPGVTGPPLTLPVRAVPASIIPGEHYIVWEVLFAAAVEGRGEINWRAFFEPLSGAVLYLQAASADCMGQVYVQDPPTAGSTATPSSTAATLDALRSTVTLQDLTSSDPQLLSGAYVTVSARGTTAAPPTQPASSCDFVGTSYSVPSTNFAAVNCYYHLSELYRLMTTWGFTPITTLFPQTTFPVTAFYMDEGTSVNAHANGNSGFTALTNYTFGSEASGSTVGIAVDWRIVMHEFNHHVLYDRVHSPNYGFAHNGGDAFAAVWFDPDSSAADRGLTFPWVSAIPRRNDRPVSSWAWGGTNDDTGYSSEEILTTCMMRAYTGIGGGAADVTTRLLASRHVCFLKIHADARLGPSPIVSSTDPRTYVTALQNADIANASPDGTPGGTLGKVFRWAFEMQGLYQAAGAPTPVTSIGQPPDVDVYIDDGRGGQYLYIGDFWDNTEVWNRRAADGGLTHEEPIVRTANFAYVRIRNRGTTTATGIVARGYHAQPSAGLTWPDDWSPMTTSELPAADLPPGGVTVVGPFTWVPTEVGHECMLMEVSCPGDRSNIDVTGALPCAFGPTPHWRLIPFDNNLAQRNVAPVAAGGGATGLSASLSGRRFFAKNPFERTIRVELREELPPFLTERGWKMRWEGASRFTLGPRASREVRFSLDPGKDFTATEVRAAGPDLRIRVRSLVDGAIIGGMSYALDPSLKRPPIVHLPPKKRLRLEDVIKDLDLRGLSHREVESIEVTHIIVDIALQNSFEEEDADE